MATEIMGVKPSHVERLAATMRPEDRAEIWASSHHLPVEAIMASLVVSVESWAIVDGDEVLAIMGVAPGNALLGKSGIPWMLTGTAVNSRKKSFVRAARTIFALMLDIYPQMVQAVDARYHGALRLMEASGFSVNRPIPFGVEQEPFRIITFDREAIHG